MDSSLPRGRSGDFVLYPDGTYGDRPSDGTLFIDVNNLGASYQWDALLNEWVDHKGEIYYPVPAVEKNESSASNSSEKKCGCGAHALGVNKHANYCDLYKETV